MKRVLIAAALLAVSLVAAHADAISNPCKEDTFSAGCVVEHPNADLIKGYVLGILAGLISQSRNGISGDAHYAVYLFPIGDFRACMPSKLPVSVETLVNPMRDYLQEKPNEGRWPFITLVPQILTGVFPCPEKLVVYGP
jgi:hypothetical protein